MSMADPLAETSPQASGPGSDVASLGLSPSASVLHPSALPTVGVQVTNAEQATIPGTSSSEHTKLDASLPDTSVPASLPSIEPARAASDLIGEDAGTASKRENDVTESIDGLAGVGGDNKKARVSACNVPEDARLLSLRDKANSEPNSASSSRQSTPSLQFPNVASTGDRGYGGAKRRGGTEEPKALPRNIDRVYLGDYDIKTWYHSPYPLDEDHSSVGSSANVSATHGYRTSSATSKVKIRIKNGPRSSKNGCAWSDPSSSENRPSEGLTDAVGTAQAQNGSSPSTPASIAATSSAAIASAIPAPKIPHLWICEGCFKYMRTYAGWNSHRRGCPHRHPPGRKVYQRGAHIIWEVDGAKEKLYAQNLSLFGKLFIDHKTIFFDVEPFLFYVITDASANFDYVLGFFSKEKVSYDNYNLAVIITFPPFQKKGFGTLMIEFSYLLSAQAAIFGTPERPLSELGFKGYASYWSAAVLRTLALAFNETDSEVASRLLSNGTHTAGSPHKASDSAAAHNSSFPRASAGNVSRAQRKASTKARSILLGLVDLTRQDAFSDALFAEGLAKRLEDDDKLTAEELADLRKVRRSALGFAGEVPRALAAKLASLPASPNRQGFVSVAQEPGETTGTADQTDRNDLRKNGIAAPSVHEGVAHSRTALDRGAQHSTPNYKTTIKPFTTPAAALTAEATLPRSRAAVLDELCTSDGFALATTLERLSQAANLRVEDATFALSECGLLSQRLPSLPMGVHSGPASNDVAWSRDASGDAARSPGGVEDGFLDNGGERPFILITRSAVRRAILERGIKRPVLDPQYVFL